MSLASFIATVETDIKEAVTWVEDETDAALAFIWTAAKPIFIAFEPTVIKDTLTALIDFLGRAEADIVNNDFAGIEQAFLMDLEAAGSALFNDAKGLGSTLLQVLIGLAKGKLAA